MVFEKVAEVTQNAIAQSMGDDYMGKVGELTYLDNQKLVDVGKDVLDSKTTTEQYSKALISQLGKIYVDSREYTSDLGGLFVDSYDWGGYLERVYFSPSDIIDDSMYDLVNGKSYDDHVFYEPKVSAKIYQEGKSITTPVSIVEDQLREAFTSFDQMNAFTSGILMNIKNTNTLAMEAYAHMLVSTGIATSVKATNTAVHLISEAVSLGILQQVEGNNPSAKEAMKNEKFQLFVMKRISLIRKQFEKYTASFSNGSIPSFCKLDSQRLLLLSDFVKECKFGSIASTFNKDEIGIGKFDEVTAWQSFASNTKPNWDYETNSAIRISADAQNKLGLGTAAVDINNCIGFLFDYMSIGICPFRQKVTSSYTAIADFWNHYHHTLINYLLDSNYKMVAFILD